jgi:hypothetical protein
VNYIDLWGLEDVYFLYTYKDNLTDRISKSFERWTINNDVLYLQMNGVKTKVDESTTWQEIRDAFYDPEARMIVTSGHGFIPSPGGIGIQSADKKVFSPFDLDPAKVSNNLMILVLENCYQGNDIIAWQSVLGNDVKVIAWTDTTDVLETVLFNTLGTNDKQKESLNSLVKELVKDREKEK